MGEKTVPENLTIMSISNSATGFYCRTESTIRLKYGTIMEQLWKFSFLRIGKKDVRFLEENLNGVQNTPKQTGKQMR